MNYFTTFKAEDCEPTVGPIKGKPLPEMSRIVLIDCYKASEVDAEMDRLRKQNQEMNSEILRLQKALKEIVNDFACANEVVK